MANRPRRQTATGGQDLPPGPGPEPEASLKFILIATRREAAYPLSMRPPMAIALALALDVSAAACALPPLTQDGRSRAAAPDRQPTFLPGAPQPGDIGYDATACGGDHGMAEQWSDDMTGYPRIGPPQMSICP